MTMKAALLAAVASLGLAATGCLGAYNTPPTGDDDGTGDDDQQPGDNDPTTPTDTPDAGTPTTPPGAGDAKPLFDSTVAPIMAACTACHVTGTGVTSLKFLGAGPAEYYSTLVQNAGRVLGGFDKAQATLVTRVLPGHYGASYSQAQVQAINTWLDGEKAARSGTTTPTDPTVKAKADFVKCMDQQVFNTAGNGASLGDRLANWQTQGGENISCYKCHTQGAASFLAAQDETYAFTMVKTNDNWWSGYFIIDSTDPANPVVKANRAKFEGRANVVNHERYSLTNNGGSEAMTALDNFVQQTNARVAAGQCGP